MNSQFRLNKWALLALVLSLFAWAPMASPYYFTGAHDGRHSLFYQLQFMQGIWDGQWYPRWGPDFGFGRGYPFMIFYSPLSFYTVQAAKSLGIGLVASVKVSWAVAFLLGAAGMFRLAKAWWRDDRAAFVSALLYTYLPYKLVDIYVRAAMAEFWALALFPWIMLAFRTVVRHPRAATIAGAALAYGALVLTHTATAFLFSPFLGAYILLELVLHTLSPDHEQPDFQGATPPETRRPSPEVGKMAEGKGAGPRTRRFLRSSMAVAMGLTLGIVNATIFWLPLLAEQQYIDVTQYVPENYNFANQFIEWPQFLSPMWDFGFALPGPNDDMSFQLGLIPVLLALLALWLLAARRFGREHSARVIWALVSLGVILLAMSPLALIVWQNVPLAPVVQFPWRLLGLSGLLLALLAGGALAALPGTRPLGPGLHPAVAIVALLTLYASYPYTMPRFTPPRDAEETLQTILEFQQQFPDMAGRLARTDEVPQSSSMISQYEAGEPLQKFRVLEGNAEVEQLYYGGSTTRARMVAREPARVEYMTYDYPGWTLYMNGQRVEHETLPPEGTIVFTLPAGEHTIEARFENTPLRQGATTVSLIGWVISLVLLGWQMRPGEPAVGRPRLGGA